MPAAPRETAASRFFLGKVFAAQQHDKQKV